MSAPVLRQLARRGFGDPLNSYAHAMEFFDGALYVGTTRANLHLRQTNDPPALRPWPVGGPDDVYALDLRAQIWRHDPAAGGWEQVHHSGTAAEDAGRGARRVPLDIGYRGMTVVDDAAAAAPGLYVTTWAPSRGGPPGLLHSPDGRRFRRVNGAEDTVGRVASYRALVPFRGRLFTAPVGRPHGRPNETEAAVVLVNEHPASRPWEAASEPGFGDAANSSVMEMCVFDDHLYAGTLNWRRGYQVWRTTARGRPPYRWTKILGDGADRGPLNQVALSMCVFGGCLYVGSGIQGGGYDKAHRVGPAAAELVRIHPDLRWDLVVGAPRGTRIGPKDAVGHAEPGFGNPFAGYFWRLCEYDEQLYVSTYDWSVFAPFLPLEKFPPAAAQRFRSASLGFDVVERRAGFDLWRSPDGEHWTRLTGNGFGNPYNFGARTLQGTPYGLFLGTANPFGPEVAARTPHGWRYVPNDDGGLEVWQVRTGHEPLAGRADR